MIHQGSQSSKHGHAAMMRSTGRAACVAQTKTMLQAHSCALSALCMCQVRARLWADVGVHRHPTELCRLQSCDSW